MFSGLKKRRADRKTKKKIKRELSSKQPANESTTGNGRDSVSTAFRGSIDDPTIAYGLPTARMSKRKKRTDKLLKTQRTKTDLEVECTPDAIESGEYEELNKQFPTIMIPRSSFFARTHDSNFQLTTHDSSFQFPTADKPNYNTLPFYKIRQPVKLEDQDEAMVKLAGVMAVVTSSRTRRLSTRSRKPSSRANEEALMDTLKRQRSPCPTSLELGKDGLLGPGPEGPPPAAPSSSGFGDDWTDISPLATPLSGIESEVRNDFRARLR